MKKKKELDKYSTNFIKKGNNVLIDYLLENTREMNKEEKKQEKEERIKAKKIEKEWEKRFGKKFEDWNDEEIEQFEEYINPNKWWTEKDQEWERIFAKYLKKQFKYLIKNGIKPYISELDYINALEFESNLSYQEKKEEIKNFKETGNIRKISDERLDYIVSFKILDMRDNEETYKEAKELSLKILKNKKRWEKRFGKKFEDWNDEEIEQFVEVQTFAFPKYEEKL